MRIISTTIILCAAVFLFSNIASPKNYVCGIASGFPPYQFQENGVAIGFDADLTRLLAKKLNIKIIFLQDDWDHVVNKLRFGKIDFIAGMEINMLRKKLFDFTQPYYHRYDVVLIKEEDKEIHRVEDLYNKLITGDRHSFIELYWGEKGIKNKIRIMQTENKRKSMELLHSGKTRAAIMPKAVGHYLGKQMGVKIKILINPDPGSPVAIAVKKGNNELLEQLDTALQGLIRAGKIKDLRNNWF